MCIRRIFTLIASNCPMKMQSSLHVWLIQWSLQLWLSVSESQHRWLLCPYMHNTKIPLPPYTMHTADIGWLHSLQNITHTDCITILATLMHPFTSKTITQWSLILCLLMQSTIAYMEYALYIFQYTSTKCCRLMYALILVHNILCRPILSRALECIGS